jgi:transcription termination factor Rho
MTETKEDEPLRAVGEPASAQPPEPGLAAKKAPRRKVATRSKPAVEPTAAAPVEASGPVKAGRSRKPKVVASVMGETAGHPPADASQPEFILPEHREPASAPAPVSEASQRSQTTSADARHARDVAATEVFGHPGSPEPLGTPAGPAPAPRPALDNTTDPAPVAAAGMMARPPEEPRAMQPPPPEQEPPVQESPAGALGAPAVQAQAPLPPPENAAPNQQSHPQHGYPASSGSRYPEQERSGDRRGQDRYPRQQSHGQHPNQRHGQPQQQQHRSYQQQPRGGEGNNHPRGDGHAQQYGGQREQREPRDPRGDTPYAGQPQQFPGQDGGDPLVSRVTETQYGEGIVEVSGKGFGFLREAKRNFVQTPADVFVTPEVCRKYNLRDGQWIKGEIRRSSRGPQLFRLTALNGEDPEKYRDLPNFEELTTINPKKRIRLETVSERYTTRVMDLMTPIGKGQRGLIVAPPRTGKTTLLQHIAEAVVKNHPEMKLIILLVDERPEEVTEIRRTVPQAEMMASSNDSDLKSHTRIAQLAMERAKRLVEANFDVFILLDSITRVGRAFNNAITGGGGRTMSGGIDARAMEIPRKIFAAARNTEEAGSLTIMATALIDTGSKMDEVIFQEFKGTGNMELVLDRKISDQRIYPAVDIFLSGTRREELLLQPWELDKINVIRRGLAGHKPVEAIERLLSFLKKFPTNAQMLTSLPG